MKRIIRDILFIAVALLYIVSTMGFGVHCCSVEGTESLSVLYVENPCAHKHEGNNPDKGCAHQHGDGCEHSHQKGCCSTDVYVVTEDQNTTEEEPIVVPEMELPHYACSILDLQLSYGVVEMMDADGISAEGIGLASESRTELCSFRI